MINRLVSVAPMIDWTDRHFRYFVRLITQHTLLYTEMITTSAILHGDEQRHLQYNACEHPLALQLGGSEPTDLARCSRLAQDYGYDEVNLNVGCPSDRVQTGRFGACLMAEPELVADCIAAMMQATTLPVTVKTRIGIDNLDSYDHLRQFIEAVAKTGCQVFIIHARKAWLKGLSPKQNREVPPLRYEIVQQLKQDFPQLDIVINGGIKLLDDAKQHHVDLDGVMIGREAYHNPYLFAQVDKLFYGDDHIVSSRTEIVEQYIQYIDEQMALGLRLNHLTRHILGLFQGVPGARAWRRYISQHAYKAGAKSDVVREALAQIKSAD